MKKMNYFITMAALLFASTLQAQEENRPFTYGFGMYNLSVLSEGSQPGNPGILLGGTDEMIARAMPDKTFTSGVNAFLLETGEQTILIDAGYGRRLFANLEICGKSPEDIDIILITHMHGDHIGGLLKEGQKAFPKAKLYLPRLEHNYWMSDEARGRLPENQRRSFDNVRKVIEIYGENLQLFDPSPIDGEREKLLPGVYAIAAYGHTPGHTAYLLESFEQQLLVWGDLTHVTPVQMLYPEVAVTYDVDPVQAVKTREHIMRYVSANGIEIAGMHIEYPGMGKLVPAEQGSYNFTLTCTCKGIVR